MYHRKRRLLHIGYRPAGQQLDAGFYDLLASEARLTSLIAIAKGDVPVAHWSALGRMFCVLQGQAGLRSWSGSMFEYLMPGLVIAEPAGSVLADACTMALREQVAFANALHVPWGIFESVYAARDSSLAYQYAPQGVPRLALRRTPADELVIAPYACVLAAQIAPAAAWRNLRRLATLGARKRYGFIDALDYSPERQTVAAAFIAADTFMAHHQGMSIAALANVLQSGVVQRWGMANPHLQAISSLLHERTPREISSLYILPSSLPAQRLRKRQPGLLRVVTPGVAAIEPTHMLSNGRYSVALRANGAGWSRWGNVGISRWRDDLLRDAYGNFLYLDWLGIDKNGDARPLVSLTQHPAVDPDASYESSFHGVKGSGLTIQHSLRRGFLHSHFEDGSGCDI